MVIRALLPLWILAATHLLADDSETNPPPAPQKDAARIIVRFKDGVPLPRIKKAVERHGGAYLKRISTVHNTHVFAVSRKADFSKLLAALRKDPAVIYAEKDQPVTIKPRAQP